MTNIHILSWNLGKRQAALDLVVDHVARKRKAREAFVVAVQECGDDSEALKAAVLASGESVHAVGNGTLSVIASEELEPLSTPIDAVGLRLVLTGATFDGRRLAIVNYHGEAAGLAGSPHLEERGGIASEARWRIDEHAKGGEVEVFGDFNAEPEGVEVASKYCFSFAREPASASFTSHHRQRLDIRARRPSLGSARGTYQLKSSSLGRKWMVLDFVALGPGLEIDDLEVLTQLDREDLVNERGPSKSDHLPVGGTLRLL